MMGYCLLQQYTILYNENDSHPGKQNNNNNENYYHLQEDVCYMKKGV